MAASSLVAAITSRFVPQFAAPQALAGAAALATAVVAVALPAQAQQPQSPLEGRVIVIGEGSVNVAPDYAHITGGVTSKAKTAKEATDANSKVMAAVTAALLDSGIAQKDIRTSRFSVQPVYAAPQPPTEARLSGYSVSNQVEVTIRQTGKVGEILDRLVGAGATNIGNIAFLVSDPSKALDQAREAAVSDARRKAELYARAAGLRLGGVAWLTEEPEYAPSLAMRSYPAGAAAAPVPIASGEETLQARITVGFDIAH